MIFYIADTHFGDERTMKLAKRPFDSIMEMGEVIVSNWNKTVAKGDVVYVLGDFALNDESGMVVNKLNGKKILLLGNHDAVLSKRVLRKFKVVDKLLSINDNGRSVCLCHYPLLSYDNSIYGGYHVFGHIHNNQNDIAFKIQRQLPNSFNCGVDVVGFAPKTLDELIELKKRGAI